VIPLEKITSFCFGASYAVALLVELLQLVRPRPVQRLVALGFGAAGLLAHTLYLIVQRPSLGAPAGSLLFLSWILAVFYLYGSIHHRELAWGVFVLPIVLGLVVLTRAVPADESGAGPWLAPFDALRGDRFWGIVHGSLLLLAAVGGCVGFVASIMYLVQARRLRLKAAPGKGVQMLSLERIELMNRRAINLAFPLFTAGVLVGVALLVHRADQLNGWTDPKIIGALFLWLVFGLLLYLRYGAHVRGRALAVWTIVAFVLLVVTLASSHSAVQGGTP
jgi:ABC-type transport system involved in cytochrome c biogenesis permease subunit